MAMTVFVAEPVELRILIGLALVFLGLMVIVGLRHAFHPAGPQSEPRAAEALPAPIRAALLTAAPVASVAAPTKPSLNKASLRAPRKSVKQTIKPFAPPRPKIQRANISAHKPSYTEDNAPYSPLPPHG
jgi:hypothetical protein